MKDRNTTSRLKHILVTCAAQAKEYGGCIAAKVPEVERDMCLKEFLALKSCMQNTVSIYNYLKNMMRGTGGGKSFEGKVKHRLIYIRGMNQR